MKTCLVCTDARQPDEAETCSLCGEASWAEGDAPDGSVDITVESETDAPAGKPSRRPKPASKD